MSDNNMKKRVLALLAAAILVFLEHPAVLVSRAAGEGAFTPSGERAADENDHSYWVTPMDITNEAAVWDMLMADSFVIRGGQQEQVVIRTEKSDKSEAAGEVTCMSQGVQVLSGDEGGWTRIRCYSSSFHDTVTEKWNELTEGWVRTDLIARQTPAGGMGLVVDKLTQRLYVFRDGRLFSTLRVSTGLPNEKQPYNETRSGEFFLVSKVGDFKSDNMVCEMALRFNSGDLLHQVPYIGKDKDYDICEGKLGERASHGCIRVQRKRTPEGVNMRWIWENYKKFTKIVIWEDVEGRTIPPTAPETAVYYNPKNGKNYHLRSSCYGVRDEYEPMTAITYAQLFEDKYSKLKPCPYCNPPEK